MLISAIYILNEHTFYFLSSFPDQHQVLCGAECFSAAECRNELELDFPLRVQPWEPFPGQETPD